MSIWVFLLLINGVFCLQKKESLTCALVDSGGERRVCHLQHNVIEVDVLSPYLPFSYSVSHGDGNCTVAFSSEHELSDLYIIKNRSQLLQGKNVDVFEIKAHKYGHAPHKVEASMSPCELNQDQVLVVRGAKYEEACKDHCDLFHSSVIEFESKTYNFSRSVTLALLNVNLTVPLKVEVINTSLCNITCEDGISFGCLLKNETPHIQRYDLLEDKGLRTLNFDASRQGYYCARVYLPSSCCPICTKTLFFEKSYEYNDTSTTYKGKKTHKNFGLLFWCFCMATIFIVPLSFSFYFKSRTNEWTATNDNEMLSERLSALNDEMEIVPNEKIQILLLYIKESNEFLTIIQKLRMVLELYFSQVWDPFSPQQIEDVTENYSFWIDQLLKCDSTKIVIVSHSSPFEPSSRREHPFDKLFHYAISTIAHDPKLCQNYTRMFVVQFEPIPESPTLSNIVPCTRYKLPDHFQALVKDITGLDNPPFSEETLIRTQDFKSTLRRYNMRNHF